MKLRPHQEEAVGNMHNGCILGGGVGTGKTFTALAYYVLKVCNGSLDLSVPMQTPKDLYVITTAKKRDSLDWEKEAAHLGIFTDPETSYGHKSFVVDSWNNIKKYENVEGALFLMDEQRVPGSGAWVKSFLKLAKKNQWILLSATPADSWMDYVPVFVANGFYRNRTEFIDNHVVYAFMGKYRKIRGFYGLRQLKKYRSQILVDMPYDRHTIRHIQEVEVEFDTDRFDMVWKKRWNVFTDEPLVDVAEMHRIGRRVVNEDVSRMDAICDLVEKHPRLIIWYNFNYELEMLRTLHGKLDIPVAEWNGHRHEEVPDTERWLYLVQYTAGSEGWNCISTDAMVYYSLNYSHKIFEQSQGRIDRLNTPFDHLWYYVLKSNSKIEAIIWRALRSKKSFHEARNEKF